MELTPDLLLNHPLEFLRALFNPESLQQILQSWGWLAYILLFLIVFVETGVFIFFLPGDSLLFVAGFVCAASNSALNIWALAPLLIVAAILGDAVGYSIGYNMGPRIFTKGETTGTSVRDRLIAFLFNKNHLIKAQRFYDRHGGKTIIYARFVPIIRTFAPLVAGAGQMRYSKFLSFNVFGGAGWVISMMVLGYYLGNLEIVRRHLEKVVIIIIILSVTPLLYEYWKSRRTANVSVE
ncbi:MAG: VTT domain-containing protein [Candidatus Sumerlaeaceae bacterium]